jgi:pimeloyl-ACP methyl ester carboxylesterase
VLTDAFSLTTVLLLGVLGVSAAGALCIDKAYPSVGGFVELAGMRLHYSERLPKGRPRGVVLLLHGASGSQADLMIPLGDRLAARGFRVLAFDRPGLGWSGRSGAVADASPTRQAELLREAALRLGVTEAIVVGHSLAGAICTELAVERPEFVRGLVLIAPVTHPWRSDVSWYYRAAAAPFLGWWFAHAVVVPAGLWRMPTVLKAVFRPLLVPDGYAKRTSAALVLTPPRFRANAHDVLALKYFVGGLAARLPLIAVPTVIVTGDQDEVVSSELNSAVAASEIPGAILTVLHGVGHSPHWAQPDAIVESVETVARRVSTPARIRERSHL